ncbi:transaldolase family protein [Ostreiculturibacter nitratireducens]|uniref:transaldolase family protein n=1 Tax=Ostreiculturibacter nitratireducens TaxID=3075226 RepID=UPI0031B6047C
MELFLDSADVPAWEELMPTRLFTGITTNPLLAARAGLAYPGIDWGALAGRAAELGAKELHGQVFGPVEGYADWAGALYEEGRKAGLRTVVKVPLTEEGIRAMPAIKALGGPVLMTAAYDAKQMFVATALGADYIAPYFGRMLEKGLPAFEAMDQMLAIGRASRSQTKILVASIRETGQMAQLAKRGLDCFTIAPNIARDLLNDANTIAAARDFEAAAMSS